PALEALTTAVGLCNDARIETADAGWRVVGQPTKGALAVLATKAGGPPARLPHPPDTVRVTAQVRRHGRCPRRPGVHGACRRHPRPTPGPSIHRDASQWHDRAPGP